MEREAEDDTSARQRDWVRDREKETDDRDIHVGRDRDTATTTPKKEKQRRRQRRYRDAHTSKAVSSYGPADAHHDVTSSYLGIRS